MSAAEFGYEKPYNRPFGPKKPYIRGFAPMELKPTSLTLGRAPARSARRSRTNTTGEGTKPFSHDSSGFRDSRPAAKDA